MHDAPVHASNRQILVRRGIRTPPRTCASARACLGKSALSLLRGAIFMHRMRARIPGTALSSLRGAFFMHRMRACIPRIALSPLRGASFMHATCARLLPVPGRSNFHKNSLIILHHGFNTQKCVFVTSRGLRPGPGVWTGQFLFTIVLAGAAEPAPGCPGPGLLSAHPGNCALACARCNFCASDARVHTENCALASARCNFFARFVSDRTCFLESGHPEVDLDC